MSRLEQLRKKVRKLMKGKSEAQLKAELKKEKARYEKEKRMESYRKQLAKYRSKGSGSGYGDMLKGFMSNASDIDPMTGQRYSKSKKRKKDSGWF